MKRSFRTLTLICAAMSILASCAKEESDPNSGKPAGPEPDQTYEYVFSLNEAALTRATLADDTILFEEGDKLGVVAVTPEKTTATEAEVFHAEGKANIAFEITQKKGIEKDGRVYAFYPVVGGSESTSTPSETQVLLSIPTEQEQTESTYDADAMPLVSVPFTAEATLPTGRKNEAGQLTMTAVGAVAEFEIYSTFPGFESQEIVAVEWEAEGLTGDFTWDFASENPSLGTLTGNKAKTAVETTKTVAATKAEAAKIYMVVAPGQHTGTVKVTTVAGEYTLTLAEALTLEAGKVTPIEVNLENTTWSESKIYRYRFAATAADELFGGLTQTVGFFAGEENIEKSLAEGAFTYDLDAPLAADASFYAYYPYNAEATAASALALNIPANQTNPADGGYDKSYIPVVAAPAAVSGTANTTEPNGTFEFHSLASVLKLNFFSANAAATEEKLESVTLAAEGAAGNFTWDLTAAKENWTFSGLDATSVTAAPAAPVAIGATAENAASVYLVLAPGTHNGVLTVETNHTSYELPLNAELTRATTQELNMELPTSSKGFGATLEEFEIVEFPTTFSDGATADLYGIDQQKTTITFSEGGFEAEDHVKGPYYAVYPEGAGAVNFNNGTFSGTVAAEQTLAEGKKSVDNAFAYFAKSNSPALAFKNATSLVKVTVMNENVSAITLTAKEGQSIAGDYTLTITEDNVSVAIAEGKGASSITLKPAGATFAKGEYYVAVIPGATENLTVNFTIGEETATKTRTIETIARNSAKDLGLFLGYNIANAEQLLAWNNDNKNWTKWDVVTLTDNIDCAGVITSENWTLKHFYGTFDGNNKTIDNFVIEKDGPAALLSKMSENSLVKNLTFGAGCSFKSTGLVTEIVTKDRVYAASLVCEISGNSGLENVVNYGDVTASHGGTAGKGNYIGGIVANVMNTTSFTWTGDIKNCKNYGDVTYSGTPVVWTCISGIAGESSKGNFIGCENHGKIEFNGGHNAGNSINLAGISGGSKHATFTNCKNLGKIISNAEQGSKGGTNMGGIVGHNNTKPVTVTNCTNGSATDPSLGEILFTGATTGEARMGGAVGYIQETSTTVTGFNNYGKVTLEGGKATGASVGGIVGKITTYNSENTISASKNFADVTICHAIGNTHGGLGGILGLQLTTATKNETQKNEETGEDVTVAVPPTSATITVTGCENSGKVERNTAGSSNFHVGGVVGAFGGTDAVTVSALTSCTNSGNVINTSEAYAASHYSYTGGVIGYARAGGEVSGCTNNGSVTSGIFTDGTTAVRVGGIAGGADNGKMTNCTNNGEVKENSCSAGGAVGGIVGWIKSRTMTMTNCDNTKPVSCRFDATEGGKVAINTIYLGGIIGAADQDVTMTDCDNSGSIANNCKASAAVNIAGLIGTTSKALTISNCTTSGAIEHKSTTTSGKIAMGGFCGLCYDNTISGSSSTGNITNSCAVTGNEYVGGFIGQVEANKKTNFSGCSYNAAMSVKVTSRQYAGALVGRLTDKSSDGITTTISSVTVKGTVAGTVLATDNYTTLCYGTGSDYKGTDGVTLAE